MSDPRRGDADPTLERELRGWMAAEAGTREPLGLFGEVTAAAARTPQRSAIFAARQNRRGLAVTVHGRLPRMAGVVAVAVLALLLALGMGILVGSYLSDEQADTPSGAFVPTGDIPESMGWLIRPGVALLADGRVLVAGGGQEKPQAAVYDPMAGTFGDPIAMPAMHQGATATTLLDGRVLIVGGNDGMETIILDDASLYDPAAGTISAGGPMREARQGHTATLLDDGRVLVVGGYPSVSTSLVTALATAELYDPVTDSFSPTGSLDVARADHTATRLPDGRVVVIGGFSSLDGETGATVLAPTAEVYDPVAGTFEPLGELRTPRSGHGAMLLDDGRIVVIGGGRISPSNFWQAVPYLASAELLDPATGTFTPTSGSLTTERSHPSLARLPGGDVLVIGGSNSFGRPHTAELFDPRTQAFQLAGTAASEHGMGSAVLLADGRVFLPGEGQAPSGGSELWVPAGGAAPLPSAPPTSPTEAEPSAPVTQGIETTLRSAPTATRLSDGRVLIAGGMGGEANATLATAEIYDADSGQTTLISSMRHARSEHQAVLMPDGKVLIVDAYGEAADAEVFDPSTERFEPAGPALVAALDGRRPVPVMGLDGHLLLIDEERNDPAMRLLDVASGRLSEPAPGCDHFEGAVALPDGRIFVACALHGPSLLFDPVVGTTTPAPGADVEDGFWQPFALPDGRILVAARQGGEVDAVRYAYTQVYDPGSGELVDIEPEGSTAPMAGSIVRLEDGRLLLVGGVWGNPSDAIRVIDPATWRYHDVGRLLTPRADPVAIPLDDGRVLVVGGAQRSADRSDPIPPGAEVIDPAAFALDG